MTKEEKELAYCSDVLAYGVNWFMLNNNQGAANLLVFHYARATAALLASHYENEKIAGEYLSQFDAVGRQAKPYLDANQDQVIPLIDSCVATSKQHATIQSSRDIKMWGKTWDEVVEELGAKIREQLGL